MDVMIKGKTLYAAAGAAMENYINAKGDINCFLNTPFFFLTRSTLECF